MECPPYCDIWDFSKPYLTAQQAHAGYYAPTLMNAWALVNDTVTDVVMQVSTPECFLNQTCEFESLIDV